MLFRYFTKKLTLITFLIYGTSVYSHGQFSPSDLPGLEIWLEGDSGITLTDDLVSQWNDQSSNARHATSFAPSIQPSLISSDLGGHQVVSFDGVYDFLEFPEITNCRTIFWVLKENALADPALASRPLLGWTGGFNFLRGPNATFWDPLYSHAGVRNGITRLNQQAIDPFTTVVPNDYFIASLQTSEEVQATNITMELNVYGRTWWGEFAELIIYSSALSLQEVSAVEEYLASKYGPQFTSLNDTIIPYGFCDVELCASPGFSSYAWSNEASDQCILVNQPGEYVVAMTDLFNRVIIDTVSLSYPGFLQIPDTTICAGNSLYWNTGLDNQLYDFEWSDNSGEPDIQLSAEGNYSVTITDSNNCETTTSFFIDIDSLSIAITLGEDLNICSGNSIGLLPHNFENLEYLWSTGETSENIIVNNSGDYDITVTDSIGCIAKDTVQIDILGTAPVISFNSSGLCEDASTEFQAVYSDVISSWTWDFGDDNSASGAIVNHTYENAGDYEVSLNVTSANGCSAVHIATIHVHSKPIVNYATNQLCNNLPVTFTDASSSLEGSINQWNWMIDGQFYSVPQVTVSIANAGFQNIILEITDDNGCTSESSTFVDVLSSPIMDFNVAGVCEGVLTSFTENIDATLSGNIISYVWNFGENTGSLLANPNHYYPQNGTYLVTLNVVAENGCNDSTSELVTIFNAPLPDFEISNACKDAAYFLQDESIAQALDPIVSWQWTINNQYELSGIEPQFVFTNPGLNPVTLLITTQNGCTGFVSQQIPVWERPISTFSFSPAIGAAPFEAQFINETSDAVQSLWFFGDTYESTEHDPEHIFTLNGTFNTQLIVWNSAGCSDTSAQLITVAEPRYDIALQQIDWQETQTGLEMTARIVNSGNIAVKQILLSWQVGNDAPVIEEWNGHLFPGMSLDYVFHSYLQIVGNQFPYVCIVVEPSPIEYTELNKTDNEICNPLSNTGLELFPPFPNPGDDRMFIRFITPVDGDLEIHVFDINGKLAMELSDMQVPKGYHQYFIDISALPVGNYQLLLEMNTSRAVTSFMKIHKE